MITYRERKPSSNLTPSPGSESLTLTAVSRYRHADHSFMHLFDCRERALETAPNDGSSASSDQEFLTEGDRVIGSAFEAVG
jgi:hypothetical protein